MPAASTSPTRFMLILPSRRMGWMVSRLAEPGKVIFSTSPSRRTIISEWAFSIAAFAAGEVFPDGIVSQPVNAVAAANSRHAHLTAGQVREKAGFAIMFFMEKIIAGNRRDATKVLTLMRRAGLAIVEMNQARCHGARYGRVSNSLAARSPRIFSLFTSQRSLRPESMEINPRWPGIARGGRGARPGIGGAGGS